MGEEQEKKSESKDEETKSEETPKAEDAKKDENTSDGGETGAAEQPPPPPPQEVVLKVYMHCEGCARKVRRCLKGFPGVEDVITDCKTSKVVVKGERADPIKVLERVQRKSHRQVELISPIPEPPLSAEEPKKEAEPKVAEMKEEPPVITVVLSVYMHCEACAQEIKKRILRMKGVESAEPDLKASLVTVKGVIEPGKLTDYVHKRTGKHAQIVKVEPEQKKEPEEEKPKEDNKTEQAPKEPERKPEEPAKENKESEGGNGNGAEEEAQADEPGPGTNDSKLELIRNEFYYSYPQIENHQFYPQRFLMQADHQYYDSYPPQMFSDENPNACSVM